MQRFGYGDVDDFARDVGDRWGDHRAHRFYADLEEDPAVAMWHHGDRRRSAAAGVVFIHAPEPLFLDYAEALTEAYARGPGNADFESMPNPRTLPVSYLNELFRTRAIDYRFNDDGRAEWHGDQGARETVVGPALDALADHRLDACRDEFEAALHHLRRGTPKDREDAIEEAAKAVESAMKVVLADRLVARTGTETAEPLRNLLRENGIVPPKTKDAILGASRLRNEYGAHGAGEQARVTPESIESLAVQTAAAAVVYLAARLL